MLRRECAKAANVNPAKDPSFRGDVMNALTTLKAKGLVERSGDVWALTEKGKAA